MLFNVVSEIATPEQGLCVISCSRAFFASPSSLSQTQTEFSRYVSALKQLAQIKEKLDGLMAHAATVNHQQELFNTDP